MPAIWEPNSADTYTYGTGDYIVTGGRYNKLLVQFGKDTPAVGFAIVVDQLDRKSTRLNSSH